jgi:hypothetical protein
MTTTCSPARLSAPSSLVLINEDTQSLAGLWRLSVDEFTYNCDVFESSDDDLWYEINSQVLVLDTLDGEIMWITDPLNEAYTQAIGPWLVGAPLILDLKITQHKDSKSAVNLLRLIASRMSTELIEGDAWLYDLPQEVLNDSNRVSHQSDEILPLYQGRFHLERLD